MANDSSLPLRRAILSTLKAAAPLVDIVPASRIYPQTTPPNPGWPFIRCGAFTAVPMSGTCLDGSDITGAIHAFATPRTNSRGQIVELAEDYAERIGAVIAASLDKRRIMLETGYWAKVRWTGSTHLQDPDESSAFHAVVNLRVKVLS